MMETTALGLHDAILLCAGVAAVYLVVTVLQLMQLKRRRPTLIVAREPSLGKRLPPNLNEPSASDLSFSHQLKRSSIEAALRRLDIEVERLRADLHAMQNEVKVLRKERSTPSAAPQYNEAMNYARRGLSAAAIASHCGISMGEAELVIALARDHKDANTVANIKAQSGAVNDHHERQYDRYRAAA